MVKLKKTILFFFLYGLERMFRQSSAELSISFMGKNNFISNGLRWQGTFGFYS